MQSSLRFCTVLTLLLAGNGRLAAQGCPAINFLTTPQLTPSGNAIIVVVRQGDGSFTEYGLVGATPSYTTPNIQNSVIGCLPVTHSKGPQTSINFNPAGRPSEAGAIVDLMETARPNCW